MWTRRQFLGRLAAASAAFATGCGAGTSSLTPVDVAADGRILVIGAGAAGAACARRLRDAGRDVVVLEARGRVGGRVHTVDIEGVSLELGAQWMHGHRDHPARPWLEQAGATWAIDPEDYIGIDGDGARLTRSAMDTLWTQAERFIDTLPRLRRALGADASVADGIARFVADDVDAGDRAATSGLLHQSIALAYSGDATAQSLDALDRDESWPGSEALVDGYGRMFEPLLAGIDVRLGAPVSRIAYDGDGVRVHLDGDVLDAAAVVVTLPLGVLAARGVEFDPPLPSSHRGAIDRLGVGGFEKVLTQWSALPWDAVANVLALPRGGQPGLDHIDLRGVTGARWLASLAAGDSALDVAGLAEADAAELVRESLAPRGALGEVTAVRVTNWRDDPWARGAWSFVPVGGAYSDYDRLAEPVGGRVLFAGEATSRSWPGTVHGAMKSGQREARRILEG